MIATPIVTAATLEVPASSLMDRRRFLVLAAATGTVVSGVTLLPSKLRGAGSSLFVPGTAVTVSESVADLATSLDHDVERIFRFVSEEIRYEPYVGILRGATGTLRGRAGNSADQALLLGELLQAGGTPFRYVSGAIDDATAAALLAGGIMDRAAAYDDALQVLVTDVQSAGGVGTPVASADAEADTLLTSAQSDAPGIIADATVRLLGDVDAITGALEAAGVDLPDDPPTLPGRERAQHLWVQVPAGADWLDLDPSLPSTPAGVSLATVDSTLDALPDDLRHSIGFVAVAEHWVGGRLEQAPVFAYETFADVVHGVPVAFTNARSDDLGINIIGEVGGGSAPYVPVLEVGPKVFIGTGGLAFGSPGDGFFGEQTDGGPVGLLDGEASGEWLEVRVTSPDGEPVVARRTIFDRVGQERRDSGVVDPAVIEPVRFVESGRRSASTPR